MKKSSKTITLQAQRGAYQGTSTNSLGYGETGIGIRQPGQYTKFFPDSKPGEIRFLLPNQFFTCETAKRKKNKATLIMDNGWITPANTKIKKGRKRRNN